MIKTQVHSGPRWPQRSLFEPVYGANLINKPHKGGFWTSTYKPGIVSSWVQWCGVSEYTTHKTTHHFLLDVVPGANVLDTWYDADIIRTYEYYTGELSYAEGRYLINFANMAHSGYDGIHYSGRVQDILRSSFDTWDCESTLWFRFCFENIRALQ